MAICWITLIPMEMRPWHKPHAAKIDLFSKSCSPFIHTATHRQMGALCTCNKSTLVF
uniref:Uncharacterized protein n=1 Tax=Arundo donax TaxID=35708 RepID=A0A0A9C5K5_ARUDO